MYLQDILENEIVNKPGISKKLSELVAIKACLPQDSIFWLEKDITIMQTKSST